MLVAHKLRPKAQKCALLIGSIAVLFSLTLAGHALLGKWLTQSLLVLHLLGIAFFKLGLFFLTGFVSKQTQLIYVLWLTALAWLYWCM